MAETIYALCALASLFCAWLLVRNYRHGRPRLALYTAICFVGLALNNVLLFVDLVVVTRVDLALLRGGVACVAMLVLVAGLCLEET